MNTTKTLNKLIPKERGIVKSLDGKEQLIKKLLNMGITPGSELSIVRLAPLGDPIVIKVKGYLLSLRKEEAKHILLEN
ncbi:MAG: ferrous iron transport protein A [Oligoflexia bacterium]|nr:ferrous iron transport protein A [Oligoflexia bacterium]